MITGVVKDGEARVIVRVRDAGGRQKQIEAIIDTGYSGWLTLPPQLIATLGLPWHSFVRGSLADGRETLFNVYDATIAWDRRIRRIHVDEANTDSLVGMALLDGYELNVQVRSGGKVTIKRLR